MVVDGMFQGFREELKKRYRSVVQMSAESRVGFCGSGFTVAVLRSWRPEVREELIRVVRIGRTLWEIS